MKKFWKALAITLTLAVSFQAPALAQAPLDRPQAPTWAVWDLSISYVVTRYQGSAREACEAAGRWTLAPVPEGGNSGGLIVGYTISQLAPSTPPDVMSCILQLTLVPNASGSDKRFALVPECPVGLLYANNLCEPVQEDRACKTSNPVEPGAGCKRFVETDYSGAGADPLVLTRHYSSRWTDSATVAGYAAIGEWQGGWRHSYQSSLTARADGTLRAFRPDGAMVNLKPSGVGGNTWAANSGSRDTVTAMLDATGQRTGYIYIAAEDDSAESYDLAGKLLSVKRRNGWITTLTYSDATTPVLVAPRPGLLISVRNHFGRELKFSYDAQGRIAEALPPGAISGQPAGGTASPIRYTYDEAASLGVGLRAQNQLTSVTWRDGAVKHYHYEDSRWPQAVTGITDESGTRYGNYAYDAQGRVSRSELAGGQQRLDFEYAFEGGQPTSRVIDYTSGRAYSRQYTFGDIAGVRYPTTIGSSSLLSNDTKQLTHSAQGQLLKVVQGGQSSGVTFYSYDAKGRETERATFPSTSAYRSAESRPALSNATHVVSTKWHATWMLPTQIAEPNKTTANTYNSKGMLTGQSWTATTDATGAAKFSAVKTGSTYATGWGYNSNSLVTSWLEKIDATTVAQMTYTVTAAGNATKATNPLTGQSANTATYDAHGRLIREVDPYGTITRSYSPRGLILEERDEAVTTTVVHNAIGLVTEVNTGTGYIWRWTYKPDHRIQSVTINGSTVANYASLDPKRLPKSWIDLFVRTAHAQAGAAVPAPAGGGLGGGRLIVVPLLWELGKRLKDSALPTDGATEKDEDCDPCKDPSKSPEWIPRNYKHLPPKRLPWSTIRTSTANGGFAMYDPALVPNATVQEAFERDVWARGKVIKNTNSETYKVVRFGGPRVGAYGGADTQCAIVKCSAKQIHGHPTAEADCNKPEVPYP